MNGLKEIWDHLRQSRHALLVGVDELEAPPNTPICLVRVDCERWDRPLGALLALRDQLEALVAQTRASILIEGTSSDALFHRELRADEDRRAESHLVSLANRLQRQLDVPVVLLIEHVDAADEATRELLASLVAAESGLGVSLLLTTRTPDLSPEMEGIVAALSARHGDQAVVSPDAPAPVEPLPELELPEGVLRDMPYEALRVLRAAAIIGNIFEVAIVAELLTLDRLTALELIQLCMDRGVPLADLGSGVFRLPARLGDDLRSSVTPSLAEAWHRLLADMLAGDREVVDLDEPSTVERPAVAAAPAAVPPVAPDRAAEHAEAAGERSLAAQRYLDAARKASAIGAQGRAMELIDRALSLSMTMAPSPERRRLRVAALLEAARIKWYAAGDGEQTYGLDAAADLVDEARSEVSPADPPELRAEIAALTARIDYDVGGPERLDHGLVELQRAREVLLDAGRPIQAARLLNDEAAILARKGQIEAAAEQLRRAREVFVQHADTDVGRLELAETNLLAARLILHAAPEHQRDPETLGFALECARQAERSFAQLGDQREQARAWEMLARLELLRDRGAEAMRYLQAAVAAQEQLGDVVGLARSTGALADLMVAGGLHEDALALLRDSIELNLRKGSRQGLAYNQRALVDLEERLTDEERSALRIPMAELQRELSSIQP
ncbi:MAG: hypothetical protein R3B72_35190 [Polyangiaceae bacterium]